MARPSILTGACAAGRRGGHRRNDPLDHCTGSPRQSLLRTALAARPARYQVVRSATNPDQSTRADEKRRGNLGRAGEYHDSFAPCAWCGRARRCTSYFLVSSAADGETMGAIRDPRAPPACFSITARRARDQSSETNQPLARHYGAGELRGERVGRGVDVTQKMQRLNGRRGAPTDAHRQ